MTPAELFDYRLAALLGWSDPEAMARAMPTRVHLGWQRYYMEEPWGTWRDNMHAALIAREVRASRSAKDVTLENFMLIATAVQASEATGKTVAALQTMGKAMTAEESAQVRKAARAKRRRK